MVMGENAVGKSSLLSFLHDRVAGATSDKLEGNHFTTFSVSIPVDEDLLHLKLRDVNKGAAIHYWGPSQCAKTDLFLVLFAIHRPETLWAVENQWIPFLQSNTRDQPWVLVGTHSDVRTDAVLKELYSEKDLAISSTKAGEATAKRLGASAYFECSSPTGEGMNTFFQHTVQLIWQRTRQRPIRRPLLSFTT